MNRPVTVLGGYLGVGKTTLLNHLLRDAGGCRLAVLVNDFGDINIDADLIESRDGKVMNLAGGCICCSVGSDLVGALIDLPQQARAPDHIVIETSGVALPGSVARTVGLVASLRLDGVIVVVDAETVQARATDRYVGDTVRAQLAQADLIVANKLDLVEPPAVARLNDWLREMAPTARVVHAVHGVVPPAIVLGGPLHRDPGALGTRVGLFDCAAAMPDGQARLRPIPAPADQRFESLSFEIAGVLDLSRLAVELVDPALGVLRAKGLLRDRDGSAKSLQLVGARSELRHSRHEDPERGRLVCIGLRDRLHRETIAGRIELCRSPQVE